MMTLKISTLAVDTLAALDINQQYEPLGGEAIFRTVRGTGLKQSTWHKTRIVTSGRGWMPAGLDALDTTAQHVLACVVPRAVPAVLSTRQATLPVARRSDDGHAPWGVAVLPDGNAVGTSLSLAGDVATLGAVSGAVAYRALYLPQFTVWISRPTDSGERGSTSYQWELTGEEV